MAKNLFLTFLLLSSFSLCFCGEADSGVLVIDTAAGTAEGGDGQEIVDGETLAAPAEDAEALDVDGEEVQHGQTINTYAEEEDEGAEKNATARAFIGLRPRYCYDPIGSGFFGRSKCHSDKVIPNKKCPTRTCAFRPTVAIYRGRWYRVAQTTFIQQSVRNRLCSNPGQVCACKKRCHKCEKRKTCQNVYGRASHRLVLVFPIINSAPILKRVWSEVKVSLACECGR